MRAVNLMPSDVRSGASTSSGSSHGVYFLLAGLAGLVIFASLWTITGRQISDRTAALDRVTAQAAVAEKRADAAAPFEAFAKLAKDRVATVTSLSATRFDFANSLREVSRVLPADVWLTTLNGSSGAADAAPTPTTNAAPAPQFELEGCTRSQSKVARLMARLRAVNGVRLVQLRSAQKPDQQGAADCPANASTDPAFTIAISFKVPGAPQDDVDSTGQVAVAAAAAAPAPSAPATAPAGDAAPAAKTNAPIPNSTAKAN